MIGQLIQFFYIFLPMMFALSLIQGFDVHLSRLIVLGIFTLYIMRGLYKGGLYIPRGSVIFVAATLLVWTVCSLFYSDVPSWTARKIFFLMTFAPLCIMGVGYLMQKDDNETRLIRAVVIGGFLAGTVALVQFSLQFFIGLENLEKVWGTLTPFFLGGTFSQSVSAFNSWFVHVGNRDIFRAIGFFPDPHVFAFYTGLIAPFAFGLWVKSRHTLWTFIGLTIVLANLLSFSRGGQMGLLGGLLVGLVLLWPYFSRAKRHAVVGLCALSTLILMIPGNTISERFASSFSPQDTSNASRLEIWGQAFELLAQNPVTGVGLGAYAFAVDPQATYRTPAYAHNILLDIGAELGFVGLALFVALVFRMIWLFLIRGSTYSYCAIISMSILLTHGLFDTPFFSVHVFPLILFLIALAAYYESTPQQNQKRHFQI